MRGMHCAGEHVQCGRGGCRVEQRKLCVSGRLLDTVARGVWLVQCARAAAGGACYTAVSQRGDTWWQQSACGKGARLQLRNRDCVGKCDV